MTKKEIETVLNFGNSHSFFSDNEIVGINRFQVFLAIKPLLSGKSYWSVLAEAYQTSDDLYNYRTDILVAFNKGTPYREFLMSKEERNYLKRLPEKLTIYRGMTIKEKESNIYGVSWSLKKEVAEYFTKYHRNSYTNHLAKTVCELVVKKSKVIAYFNSRNEDEIIYIHKVPDHLKNVK